MVGRFFKYLAANSIVAIVLLIIDVSFSNTQNHPVWYLSLLSLVLSLPLFFVQSMRGPYIIMLVACPVFILFYGLNDLLSYFFTLPRRISNHTGIIISAGEIAVLSGVLSWMIGYYVAVQLLRQRFSRFLSRDWRISSLVVVGILFVATSFWATWDLLMASGRWEKFVSQGAVKDSFLVVARMMELPGAVMLSHAYLVSKSRIIMSLVLLIAIIKFPMGLMLNSKEVGFSFALVLIVTKWLHDGVVPSKWIIIGAVAVIFYVPLSYSYRTVLDERHLSTGQGTKEFARLLDKAVDGSKDQSDPISGVLATAGRIDFKPIVELIVSRVGRDVQYQDGATLVALPLVFIPRMIMREKPSVAVGKLFNQELRLSANPDTYISTTFMGELYWNFSWLGLAVGMWLIGFSLGIVGVVTCLQDKITIGRMMILACAVYLLVLKSETGITQQFSLFLRTGVGVIILDRIFAVAARKGHA